VPYSLDIGEGGRSPATQDKHVSSHGPSGRRGALACV